LGLVCVIALISCLRLADDGEFKNLDLAI